LENISFNENQEGLISELSKKIRVAKKNFLVCIMRKKNQEGLIS
jgi:hypothetical protein